ncbi:MAG: aldose 1-epimerase family protein [Eubacteriales bacterium]|nr:aldose 1-epimerase family protein [Eubacteriales bacterium]
MDGEKREGLLRKVGSIQQLAYVRPIRYEEGRSGGLRAFEVKNGPLSYRVLADKCMDVGEMSYKGVNVSFLSKPGLQGRNHYDTNGDEALRSIMGGLFFTAGLENICAPHRSCGKDYPMHGRIRTTPAEHICADAFWEADRYVLRTSGEMREAELFGENLVLRRTIETLYGERTVTVVDEIENQSFRPEPMMILYHINIGYPLLDEGCELLVPTRSVTPRDEASRGKEGRWNRMDAPKDNEPEYVFIHEPMADEHGKVTVSVLNDRLELGIQIQYTAKNLPRFMEWKSTASGDYVLGLEPSNSSVYGRAYHEEHGDLHMLEPFAKETNILSFTILEGARELEAAREENARLLSGK